LVAGAFLIALFVYIQYSRVEKTEPTPIAEDEAIDIEIPEGYASFGIDVSHHQGRNPME